MSGDSAPGPAARALLIQISDIHFQEPTDAVLKRTAEIAAAVQPLLPLATRVVLIITGDIAQSGKSAEYNLATGFIHTIAADIESRHGKPPDIITVPGNHDADFESPRARIRTLVLNTLKSGHVSNIELADVEECVSVFDAYDDFAKKVETGTAIKHSPIWRAFEIDVGGKSLHVHCVNNAWSCELRTAPGSLGFPTKLHHQCADPIGALRILLMHHPAHWISSHQYREFRRFTRECAEICFTGHEHESNAGANRDSETGLTAYVEGAVLQDRNNSNVSGFNASLIDFEANNIETTEFRWNGTAYLSARNPLTLALPNKANVVNLNPEWQDFISDLGSNVSHRGREHVDLADLYVYPELEQQEDSEENPLIVSSRELSKELASPTASTLVKGEQSSGKTALLKRLYADALERELYPVYINGRSMKSSSDRDLKRLLERSISDQYAPDSASKVLQAKPEQRILLLDNLDRCEFPDRYMSDVLKFFDRQFLKIIATVDPAFDLKEALLTADFSSLRSFVQMQLLEFGFRLRFQLVSKWFGLDDRTKRSEQEAQHADKIISRVVGRGLVPSFPIYVLILLQSIEVGRAGELENSALGHYYEYMILQALEPRVRQEHVHEILNYCSQFAWFLHSVKKEKVSDKELRSFHAAFETKFDLELKFEDRKRMLLDADLFIELGDEVGFRYPYSYFFFLGRYLAKNLQNEETLGFIKRCCQNLHVRENGNAILFLAHHSNDQFVFDALREAVDSRFAETAPLQFQQDTEALDKMVDKAPVLVFNEAHTQVGREKAQVEDHDIEQTFDDAANGGLESGIASDEQRQVLQLLAEVNGLIKGIELLGMAMKANFGTIDTDAKQKLIDSLFKGGLRGLRVFVEAFSEVPDHIIAELGAAIQELSSTNTIDRDRAVKVRIFQVIGRFSFWFIRRIGSAVGSKSMAPAIKRYVDSNDTIANQLVAMSSSLETPGRIPFDELQALNSRVSKQAFAQSVLRYIVFTRIHMYKTSEAEKQQVFQELEIQISTQHVIDYKTRKAKRLTKT
ncbi:STAND family AAA ATPase [Roseateles sp. 22389]|uniref:STAND family AAA ATPase n=1 Tax=Roseateles sp. 22389 TaxID=3453916 RepID=UPI003F83D000